MTLRPGWKPTGWWRVIAPDGSLWCESSDEEENRRVMRPGDKLQRHIRKIEEKWVDAPAKP